jgi:hypothetical protein
MSRLASIIAALCLATGAVAQTDTMQEQGFTPGMTEEQLLQQLKDKGAECTSGYSDGGMNCVINGEEVAFAFTRERPRRVSVITNISAQRLQPRAASPATNPMIQGAVRQINPQEVAPTPAPQQQNMRVRNPTEAACTADAVALVPQGTRVLGTSVAFSHSVRDEIFFYNVTVEAEQSGKKFQYQYQCRHWGPEIRIMRRALGRLPPHY